MLNNLNGSLDLVRADGKTFTLFSSGGTLGPITWSPDSHRLIIAQVRPPQTGLGGALLSIVGVNTAGANVIWQVKTTGDQPDKPAQILELAMGPANDDRVVWGEWSPNSRYVLFWVGSSSPSIAADGLPLRMLDTETGQSTLIDTTVVNRRYQSWSPESSRLVLSAGGDRSAQVNKWLELFTVSPPQVTTVVSKTEQIPGIVAWSPRGTWIAYAAVAAADTGSDAYLMTWQNPAIAKRRIFLLNPATRERIRLNNMDTFQDAPAWSDDGTTLYYVQRDKSDIVLAATNPVTSTVRLVEESRRPAPQVIGYYGQSRWEDVLGYRPDAPREPLPALTQTLTDTVNGYVLRYPAGWAVDNGWHSTGFDCTGCPALNPSADGTPFDPGPFSGQIFIGLQSLAYTNPTLDAALKQVLAQPGPGQGSSLVSFAQRRVTVDNRNAIRVETMDDIGTINHVLLVGYGKQLLVLRGWGDGRVFDAIVSTINLR